VNKIHAAQANPRPCTKKRTFASPKIQCFIWNRFSWTRGRECQNTLIWFALKLSYYSKSCKITSYKSIKLFAGSRPSVVTNDVFVYFLLSFLYMQIRQIFGPKILKVIRDNPLV
jgi:hypothetical protein